MNMPNVHKAVARNMFVHFVKSVAIIFPIFRNMPCFSCFVVFQNAASTTCLHFRLRDFHFVKDKYIFANHRLLTYREIFCFVTKNNPGQKGYKKENITVSKRKAVMMSIFAHDGVSRLGS